MIPERNQVEAENPLSSGLADTVVAPDPLDRDVAPAQDRGLELVRTVDIGTDNDDTLESSEKPKPVSKAKAKAKPGAATRKRVSRVVTARQVVVRPFKKMLAAVRKIHRKALGTGRKWVRAHIDRMDFTRAPGKLLPASWKDTSKLRQLRTTSSSREVYEAMLAIARGEAKRGAVNLRTASFIDAVLASAELREKLLQPVRDAAKQYPNSIYLTYIYSVMLAKSGDYSQATDLVLATMKQEREAYAGFDAQARAPSARDKVLTKVWRVVDSISRDDMAVTGDGGAESDDAANDPLASERSWQQGQTGTYLDACRRSFEHGRSLKARLDAIENMTKLGLRRMPTYHDAYALARECYREIRPQWIDMIGIPLKAKALGLASDKGVKAVRLLTQVMRVAEKLGFTNDLELISTTLFKVSKTARSRGLAWTIAAALSSVDAERWHRPTLGVLRKLKLSRTSPRDVKAFFLWALRCGEYGWAMSVYKALPNTVAMSVAAAPMAKILQRKGSFSAAATLLKRVCAANLAKLNKFDPVVHWGYIKQIGELEFAANTTKYLRTVPQPTEPKGVIFLAPRAIDQTTRFPLIVLLEMKRRGWAIIPLFEGVLPLDKTGNAKIDQFLGCFLGSGRLRSEREREFDPIENFEVEVETGHLRWDSIDLTHPLWEEAAVNRRRYNVDYTCPALISTLSRLSNLTRMTGVVLQTARRVMAELDLPLGFMVNFQARLPDVVVRLYCETHGDPEKFFCIHGTNGYQNYFANFSSPVSTRMAMRNMTATRINRTASFPTPSEFETFFDEHREEAPSILERVRDITKVRRSTSTATVRPAEAEACRERIAAWRAEGGLVACAFGKVVCDSAVPFDGGPVHRNMAEWLNHTIEAVRGSSTLLLIKPHPHELKNEIGAFLTEYFRDLIIDELPENVIYLGHNWFDMADMKDLIDIGTVYNGTTTIELGLLQIPGIVCSDFAPRDYPIGQIAPRDRGHYERMLRGEQAVDVSADVPLRAAVWLHYMSGSYRIRDYRYHSRQITNKVVSPPYWFHDDVTAYLENGDPNVAFLADQLLPLPRSVSSFENHSAAPEASRSGAVVVALKNAHAESAPMPAGEKWAAQPSNFTAAGRNNRTFDQLGRLFEAEGIERPKILSFGCSEGLEPLDILRVIPNAEVYGCDISRDALAVAADRCKDTGISIFESTSTELRARGPFHAVVAMNVLVNWPASYGLEQIGHLYPFRLFDETITTIFDVLTPGGYLGVYNACFCVEHTGVGARLQAIGQTLPKDNGWVDKFDTENRRLALACDTKRVPILMKDWRRYMNNNAGDSVPRAVHFETSGPADCTTILWRKLV
ncbi:class I SAM-dependent methyltransferase [Shinella sp. M31]|uniref:class I SAM-dependent methyltransferase n=1 Tax=Shinella sp. M31 TaxID=3368615 RepID=UPI003BA0B88C